MLSLHVHDPSKAHWQALERILYYLKATINNGLFLSKTTDQKLHVYCDVDWDCNLDDKKSITAFYYIYEL